MRLPGPWLAAPTTDELHRSFSEPGLDDSGWESIQVPGHWRTTPAFADTDGAVLYRTRFEHPATAPDRRAWIRFDGIFYQGDVFLDGAYLGDTEGYFAPHAFEVTGQLRDRREHVLAVEVACSPAGDRRTKRAITGIFQHGTTAATDPNPGGLWRPVHVVETGSVRIERLRCLCVEADEARAVVAFHAVLDATDSVEATIATTVGNLDQSEHRTLASGSNIVEWRVTLERPRLWWPHALGEPALHDVVVCVRIGEGDGEVVSDERRLRTGLRSVRMRNYQLSVNGERLFLKGANHGLTDLDLAGATAEDCRQDVELALDAGLDLLRLHGHVARPETYDTADELGLLLWQDFPLRGTYARQLRKQAIRQAGEMVDLLAHHPSIAVWCGHDDPDGATPAPGAAEVSGPAAASVQHQTPGWNRTVLDRSVRRAIDRADGTRPALTHSGVLPHLPNLDGTDSHLWFGWRWGDLGGLDSLARRLPRLVRFVSAFGAQAIPETDDFVDAGAWPHLDWDELADRYGLEHRVLRHHVPVDDHDEYKTWKAATQAHQARVITHHVETLRRLKYRPTGGFAQFLLADAGPSAGWSVLDHERRPKLGFEALRAACQPVIVVADPLPPVLTPGEPLALDVHVVSDRRTDLSGTLAALVEWPGGSRRWRFEGDVPADSCVRVGTITLTVPDAHGELTLSLDGRVGPDPVRNEYRATVA